MEVRGSQSRSKMLVTNSVVDKKSLAENVVWPRVCC